MFFVRGDAECASCRAQVPNGDFIVKERGRILCLKCAGLNKLTYLPSGDATLTRRATKHTKKKALVVTRVYRNRQVKRHGILVEPSALKKAEKECRSDAAARAKRRDERERELVARFASAVRRRYPSAPKDVPRKIARHSCETSSGRVGRTADAKKLSGRTVELAMRAHVRHHYTPYDTLIDGGMSKAKARTAVKEKVEKVLARWVKARKA